MTAVIVINLIILALTAYMDHKEKQFYIIFPLLMLLLNGCWRFFNEGILYNRTEIIFLVLVVYLALVSKQKIGYGDIAIIAALLPFCGFAGIIRIITDSMLIMLLWNLIKRNKEKEVPFVPYLSAGFLLWCIL